MAGIKPRPFGRRENPQVLCYHHRLTFPKDQPAPARMFAKFVVAAALAASVAAHATFQEMWINGVDQGSSCVRLPQSNSPVTSVSTSVRPLIVPTTCRC